MAHERVEAPETSSPDSGVAGTRDPEIDEELLTRLREIGHRWTQRTDETWAFPGSGRFTDDARLRDPVWIITELQKQPELWEALEYGTTPPAVYEKRHTGKKHSVGRDRMPGHWILIALAYALTSKVELELWYDLHSSDARLWEAAGFEQIPSISVFYERITELEKSIDGIELATCLAWQIALRKDDRIGRHWKIGGQAYESHVRLQHDPDCPKCCDGDGKKDAMPQFIQRQALEVASELRHKENEQPVDEQEPDGIQVDETIDESSAASVDIEQETLDQIAAAEQEKSLTASYAAAADKERRGKTITIQGHRYFSRDEDAGFKIYQSSSGKKIKQWTGGLALKLSEQALGITFTTLHIPADEVEHKHWGNLLYQGAVVMQTLPENILGDRGHATREVKKLNTLLNIGSVIPFRKPNGSYKSRADLARDGEFNEYGFPLCQVCGSPGEIVDFRIRNGEPMIAYRCTLPGDRAECERLQSKHCSDEWLLFGPLNRNDPLYFELRADGKPAEKNNSLDRRRYMLAGANPDTRAKRVGTAFLDLRACLGSFLDIFRVLLRQGWLESEVKLNPWEPKRRKGGETALHSFNRRLRRLGLLLPSGPRAQQLGLAFTGEIPDGWVPVAERLTQQKKADEKERRRLKRELAKQKAAAAKAA